MLIFFQFKSGSHESGPVCLPEAEFGVHLVVPGWQEKSSQPEPPHLGGFPDLHSSLESGLATWDTSYLTLYGLFPLTAR